MLAFETVVPQQLQRENWYYKEPVLLVDKQVCNLDSIVRFELGKGAYISCNSKSKQFMKLVNGDECVKALVD